MTRQCLLCNRPCGPGTSLVCRACHSALWQEGLRWCNAGRHAVAIEAYGTSSICRACQAKRMRGRPSQRTQRLCVLCAQRQAERNTTDICKYCRQSLTAEGQRWCQAGHHAVDRAAFGAARACLACERDRQAGYGRALRCATCQAPLLGHARCQGCERLLHGLAAAHPLCGLCARDRAAGVPPKGFGTDLEEAA